jgi:GT2 family glycosyltransferase
MQLSILVVSRTAELVNRFCAGLDAACSMSPMEAEILVSWNGSDADEQRIVNSSRYDLHIAQRVPYHFAGNMKDLAALAGGEVLMLANDDLMLDPSCVDAGLELLTGRPEVGLVGALLRDQKGLLSHAGINIDLRQSSYHLLDRLLPLDRVAKGMIPTAPVAAVTGALQWIGRDAFQRHPFNPAYQVNGEDVELCFDVQQHLDQQVWLCTEASAIHEAETTRSQDPLQAGNSADQLRLRTRIRHFLDHATGQQLRVLLQQQQRESQLLRDLVHDDLPRLQAKEARLRELEQEFGNAEELRQRLEEQDKVLLSLREERLRMRDQLDAHEGRR